MVSDIFLTMDLTVVENCWVNQFPQLIRTHFLNIQFLKFSRRADSDGVIDLRNTFNKILNFDINKILTLCDSHESIYTAMITFHEFNVIVFVFEKVWLKLSWNTLLWNYVRFELAPFFVDFSQKVFYIRPSNSIYTLDELSSPTAFFMVDIQIKESILEHIKSKYIWGILKSVVNQIRILIGKVAIIRPEVVSCQIELTENWQNLLLCC